MGPAIDSRIETLDFGISLLQIKFEVQWLNTTHQLSDVM